MRKLVTWITLLAVFAMAARVSVDTDTWWHLRAGQWMVENRDILQVDHFSYTRGGEPWQYPGWLVEIPMYLIFQAAGPGGLNVWTALMVALAFAFIWRTLTGGPFLRALAIIFAAAVSGVYWAARPYLVTFLLSAIYLWLLEDFRRQRSSGAGKRLLWLPVLMVLWVNSHGGFAVGFILLAVYLTGLLERIPLRAWFRREMAGELLLAGRPLLIAGVLMVIAVMINPSGPEMYAYPFRTVSIQALQDYIQEWQSPDFHSLSAQPFAWLLLLTFGIVGFSRKRLALVDFLLFAGFAYMGLMAGRNVALFALAAPMVLTRHAEPLVEILQRRLGIRMNLDRPVTPALNRVNGLLFGALALAVVLKTGMVVPESVNRDYFKETMPVDAVSYLQTARPPGRLFNTYNWGGYLLWALPEYPVFIDGRTDLYNDEIIGQWLQVMRAEAGWEDVLDRWEVNLILVEPEMPVVGAVEEAGWELLYEDEMAVLWGR